MVGVEVVGVEVVGGPILVFIVVGHQGVTLALARSPRRVSKVSGERKSLITRPFGEYNFRWQDII